MWKNTFLWHDYETFGLKWESDRMPAEFACIRTDEDLNIISPEADIYCRPCRNVLPSPEACLITGITPQDCEQKGLPEHEFAKRICGELSRDGTIGIGYNNFGFDDEVTRFLFWRNFLPPYDRESRNGRGRWDLYPLAVAFWALRPDGIEWPLLKDWIDEVNKDRIILVDNQGGDPSRITFSLECLAKANGLEHEEAHNALSDVKATIELARLMKRAQPRLWQWALSHRTKQAVQKELGVPAILVSPVLGQDRGCMTAVMSLGPRPDRPNDVFVWDLMRDPEELFGLKAEEFRARMEYRGGREDPSRLPVYVTRLNRCPFVCGNLRIVTGEQRERYGLDYEAVKANAAKFNDKMRVIVRSLIDEAFRSEDSDPDNSAQFENPETALYGAGFASPADKRMSALVASLPGEDLAARCAEGRIVFEKQVYSDLLLRYRAKNFPGTLSGAEAAEWQRIVAGNLGPNLEEYASRLDSLSDELSAREDMEGDEAKRKVVERVMGDLNDWLERVSSFVDDGR